MLKTSNLILVALQETLNFDPKRQHNQEPPDLWRDDDAYLLELRKLIVELQALNKHLESSTSNKIKTRQSVLRVGKRFDVFLHHYSATLGKGAGYLTVAAVAGLLYQAGVGPELVTKSLGHVKIPQLATATVNDLQHALSFLQCVGWVSTAGA